MVIGMVSVIRMVGPFAKTLGVRLAKSVGAWTLSKSPIVRYAHVWRPLFPYSVRRMDQNAHLRPTKFRTLPDHD